MKRPIFSLFLAGAALVACSRETVAPRSTADAPAVPDMHAGDAGTTSRGTEASASREHREPVTRASARAAHASTAQSEGAVYRNDGCAGGTSTLFACRTAGSGKTAALCMRGTSAETAFYRFGTPTHAELRYPANEGAVDASFHRTSLLFAGATGGYAYSFDVTSTTYALYSISGDAGLARAGVAVFNRSGQKIADLACAMETLEESDSVDVIRVTREWSPDPRVAKGLQ
ncbi:hypothetical protein [Lysobacter xanthus]